MALDRRARMFGFVIAIPAMGAWLGVAHARDKPKPSAGAVGVCPSPCPAPTPAPTPRPPDAADSLAVKWVRDSAEYATLTRMVYDVAARQVAAAADAVRKAERDEAERAGRPPAEGALLAVVLDIDETALDNSVYQLERAAYRLPFSGVSWEAWVRRQAAGVVPGVVAFVRAARAHGVRVAWISNRDDSQASSEATRRNLDAWELWNDADRLCLQHADDDRSKAARRGELRAGGAGPCSFGRPARVLAYMGDQLGDFPGDDEAGAEGTRATDFGKRYFLLPDPMYGGWTNAVTRPLP